LGRPLRPCNRTKLYSIGAPLLKLIVITSPGSPNQPKPSNRSTKHRQNVVHLVLSSGPHNQENLILFF
jgi:hypothetical protein